LVLAIVISISILFLISIKSSDAAVWLLNMNPEILILGSIVVLIAVIFMSWLKKKRRER